MSGVWRRIDVGEGAETVSDGFDSFGGAFDLRECVDSKSPVAEVQSDRDVVEMRIDRDEFDTASQVSERSGDDVFAGYAF